MTCFSTITATDYVFQYGIYIAILAIRVGRQLKYHSSPGIDNTDTISEEWPSDEGVDEAKQTRR